ncbi:hypothetical protein [Kingella kingae]|uniref:hypothetical protein n=1 Tax=Kingella kingae TaxID=504 RepID=UPI0012BC258C|nr:hypothetical protein [Kingella kingae]
MVDIREKQECIVIELVCETVCERKYSLDEFLSTITDSNQHHGSVVGVSLLCTKHGKQHCLVGLMVIPKTLVSWGFFIYQEKRKLGHRLMMDWAVVVAICFFLDKYLNYLEKMRFFLKKSLIYF